MKKLNELRAQPPAQTTFTGLGLWDVFAPQRRRIGIVAMSLDHPPFITSDQPDFTFAPGHYLFPHGLNREEPK